MFFFLEDTLFYFASPSRRRVGWDNMESSSDFENEVASLSLMARDCESDEEETSSNLDSTISFDELQNAFNGLHK